MLEKEIAIIGTSEVVKPFLASGINCFEVSNTTEANNILQVLVTAQKTGIIFISESFAEPLLTEIEKIKRLDWPAVNILPEYGSTKKLALTRLEHNLARAIGKKV